MKDPDIQEGRFNRGFSRDTLDESNISQSNIKVGTVNETQVSIEENDPSPNGGCLGWTVVFAAFMVAFIRGGFRDSFGLLMPYIEEHYMVGNAEASVIISSMNFLVLACGPLAAFAVQKSSHRITIIFGVLLSTIGLLCSGLYTMFVDSGYSSVLFMYVTVGGMTGLGFGLMYLPPIDIINYHFTKNFGLVTGIAAAGSPLGQVALAPLINIALSKWGLATSLCCLSGTMAFGIIFGLLFRVPLSEEGNKGQGEENKIPQEGIKDILRTPKNIIILVAVFLFQPGMDAGFAFTPSQALNFGIDSSKTGLLLSIMGGGTFVGRILFGFVLDKCKSHAIILFSTVMIMQGLAMLASPFTHSLEGQAVFCGVFGFTTGAFLSGSVVVIHTLYRNIGLLLGLYLFSAGLGSLVGPPIAGWLYDIYGNYTIGFIIVGSSQIFGALTQLLVLLPYFNIP